VKEEAEGKVLALDWGSKRMGIALSDPGAEIAFGRESYDRKGLEQDLQFLRGLVEEEKVKAVVIGLPLRMNGERGKQAEEVLRFKKALEEELSSVVDKVETVDERLTSNEAERVMLQADLSRARRKEKRDQLAATLILQRYLDRKEKEGGS